MPPLSEADQYLVDQINQGSATAWQQLVDRYHGRLLAFASARLKQAADAEDTVQETFIALLNGLKRFRGQSSLETYLFSILRRKIIDGYRAQRAHRVCLLQDLAAGDDGATDAFQRQPAPVATGSWYVARSEQQDRLRDGLAEGVRLLLEGYKAELNFRDIKLVELLFYCQLPNKQVAALLEITENQVGVSKHRLLKRLREQLGDLAGGGLEETTLESLLTETWETHRPSCPKRSTIGAYLLGSLAGDWRDYVDFHLHTLGCHFCRANFDDLQQADAAQAESPLRRRILESTVGFLKQP